MLLLHRILSLGNRHAALLGSSNTLKLGVEYVDFLELMPMIQHIASVKRV